MTYSQVDRLRDLREKVAKATRDLARRKLERAPIRAKAVQVLIDGGATKTDADKRHMEDAELVAFDGQTADLEYEAAILLADAEATRLEIEYEMATARTVGV